MLHPTPHGRLHDRHVTRPLEEIRDELLALYDELPELEVLAEHARTGILAHGWYTRLRRSARALAVLDDAGFQHESAPIRRSMLEHALALRWLVDVNEAAVDALVVAHQARLRRMRAHMSEGWAVRAEDLDSLLEIDVPNSPEQVRLAFTHLNEKYGSGDFMVAWLLETGTSHPSYSSATAYSSGDGTPENTHLHHASPDSAGSDRVVVLLLLVAGQAFNDIVRDHPWTERLQQIEAEIGEVFAALRASDES